MKLITISLLSVLLMSCSKSESPTEETGQVNFRSLPTTFQTTIEMDPSVEAGVDAFARFEGGGDTLLAISEQVGRAAGIDTEDEYHGKVEVTVSGEHEISNSIMRVYKVSRISRL